MRQIILAALISVGMAPTAQAGFIFQDNFNSGPSILWGNEVGAWAATGGVYYASQPYGTHPLTYTSLPFDLTDFVFQVDINDVGDGGIWLRSQDNRNGVVLVTGGEGYWNGSPNPQAGRDLYWHVFVDGVGNPPGYLGRVSNVFDPGVTDATIRVEVVGNTYKAYVDGVLMSTIVDDTYTHGKVALYDAVNPQQSFDNVALSAVPEPSSIIVLGSGILTLSTCGIWGRWRRVRAI